MHLDVRPNSVEILQTGGGKEVCYDNVANRSRHRFHHTVGIVALVLGLGTLPLTVFAQAATSASSVKIGIIGSGNLGGTLGTLWVKSGHPVLFSSPHPEALKKLVDSLQDALAVASTLSARRGF